MSETRDQILSLIAAAKEAGLQERLEGLRDALAILDAHQPAPDAGAEAAKVLTPVFLRRHEEWARSKGRNPLDYTSVWQQAADRLDALAKGEPL